MRKIKDVINQLEELTLNDITTLFIKEGIKGVSSSSCHCPIANYISKETGHKIKVHAVIQDLTNKKLYQIPNSVSTFIVQFDLNNAPKELYETDPVKIKEAANTILSWKIDPY